MVAPDVQDYAHTQPLVTYQSFEDAQRNLPTPLFIHKPSSDECQAFEHKVVCHCSPTLSSLKPGNLFRCCYTNPLLSCAHHVYCTLQACYQKLAPHGVHLEIVSEEPGWSLVYVYRSDLLERALNHPVAAQYLHSLGYHKLSTTEALANLKQRFKEGSGFPHEIGFFLGYPPQDVIEFITSAGENHLMCGHWKVYSNLEHATRQFELFRNATKENLKRYAQGCPIELLVC